MLFLTITTTLIVVGSVLTVVMIRAAGPAEPISVQTAGPRDLPREIEELRAQMRQSDAALYERVEMSEREIQQLRMLYVNHREDVARALAAADRASVRRDSELRRDIQPARRLELVTLASQTGTPSSLQLFSGPQPDEVPLDSGASLSRGPSDSAVG